MKINQRTAHPTPSTTAKSQPLPSRVEEPKDELDWAAKRELDRWQRRLRDELGVLTTPPLGEVAPAMSQARNYLVDLTRRLAPDLNIDLRVELFSGDVPQTAMEDSKKMEDNWKSVQGPRRWPVRDWLEIPESHDDKAIYRLVVDVGMLRTLETEDELAFVLSQQLERALDFDKQDPKNEKNISPSTRSFVDSRDMQVAADQAAIKRMADAGYNPRAAFHALNRLYAQNPIQYPENDLDRALTAAAHNHEAEGIRVGAVETEVENYVRRGETSVNRKLTPMPEALKLQARPQYNKPVDDIEKFKANYRSLAERLATDSTPNWMLPGWDGAPPDYEALTLEDGDRQDKEEALVAAADHLDGLTGKTGQQKVDGLLRLMLSLRRSALPEEGFSAEANTKLHDFMAKNGRDWNADHFIDTLKNPTIGEEEETLHYSFLDGVLFKHNFQDMAAGTLPGLARAATRGYLNKTGNEVNPYNLTGLIDMNWEGDRETWPLAKDMNEAALEALSGFDYTSMVQETAYSGLSRATEYATRLFGLKGPDKAFKARIRQVGNNLAQLAAESREQRARVRLQLPLQEPKKLNNFLVSLGESESWKEFTPDFDQNLQRQLIDIATISTHQPNFADNDRESRAYPEGIERRFVEGMKSSGQTREGITHLVRHMLPARRVRSNGERTTWLGEAARTLAASGIEAVAEELKHPNRSQNAAGMRDALIYAYQLKPEELPDTETPALKVLNERVKAGEFIPKREDYQYQVDYEKARSRYYDGQLRLRDVVMPLSTIESRDVLSRMALLGHNAEVSQGLVKGMPVATFQKILEGAEAALERYQVTTSLYNAEEEEHVGTDAGAFVMDGLVAVQHKIESLENWYDVFNRSYEFSEGSLQARDDTRRKLGDNLFTRLDGLDTKALEEWLSKDNILDLLSAEHSSELLLKLLGSQCAPDTNPVDLGASVSALEERYELIEKYPLAYVEFRDKVAEQAKLQPHNVDTVFPKVVRGVTDTTDVYRRNARALSGLVAVAREKSPAEQLATIEYLMGRRDQMPAYLEAASEDQDFAPLQEAIQTTRHDLLEADGNTRVLVANSFLAGPSGLLRTEEGKEAVIGHFLKDLSPDNRELADKIARGVLYSHGDADTLAVAYIMGQKPKEPVEGDNGANQGKLDEATILTRLFDAYGVPGIKMKQYLAFTSEFADFKEAFESAQDASMPLNYYQVLKLVQNRFGDEWPQDLKIDRVLGSGSVNVAIRYTNQATGKREVVSLGRQDIEESTRYDFNRFDKLIGYMTETPEDREKYGYILGLLGIIRESVALEFQKDQAMAVQKQAYETYRHETNGWHVRSIDAFKVEHLGLFMEEAKGKTARKIYNENKELYQEAMDAMAAAEFGVLRGVDSSGNWKPRPLFANPDFHDGQVLIDKDSKSVTILDFGQAVPLSNEDRVGGLDLLTVIGKADWGWLAARRLNDRYFEGKKVITSEMLKPILEREDRMDCFIHLLSLLSRNGAKVPISSVHWILGLNRQIALAEKIGDPIDEAVKKMVTNHKAGLPLATFNASYGTGAKSAAVAIQANHAANKTSCSLVGPVAGAVGVGPLPE
ncbi:MAG: hypothetical protein KIS61_21245 [Candidatus Eremiobacteraeota bacterium]|nr:hypothetical protein [Candidatus Eremiobacteraeota bacterium]